MIYEKNIKALNTRYPHLISNNIERELESIEFLESKSGDFTAIYNGLYLHSRHNPKREATKIVSQIESCDLIVLAGFGLGYICDEIISNKIDTTTVVFEPNLELFLKVLRIRDITHIIKNRNFHLIINSNSESIKNFFIPQKVKKIKYIPLTGRVKSDIDYFSSIEGSIKTYLDRMSVNINTLKKFGKLWVKNQCKNIPYMGYKNDLSDIFNKFKGIPGIIVSAGPSMEEIVPYLKEIKDKFLILAVDTAFKSLLDEGIEPDFVMSIDSQYWNSRHLTGGSSNNTILIADSSIQTSVLREFKNRTYFTKSSFPLGRYFENHRKEFPKVASGGSVSTNIWDFAQKLGLNEINFIGQDLGFPGGVTHYKNSYFEKNMLISSTKTNSIESQSFKYIYDGFPNMVISNDGKNIISDRRMDIYIKWFHEKLRESSSSKTYNLSPSGCRIDGMPYKNVSSILSYRSRREEIDSIISNFNNSEPTFYLSSLYKAAVEFRKILNTITIKADEAYNLCKKIEIKVDNRLDIKQDLETLDTIDRDLISYEHSQTLSFIIEPFINQITDSNNKSPLEALKTSLKLYKKLGTTGHLHLRHIDQSIKNIDKILK